MSHSKVILAAAVIFLTGVVSGVLTAQLFHAKTRQPTVPVAAGTALRHPWMAQRLDLMRRLTDRLSLDPDQRERIDLPIEQSQRRLRELWIPIEPKAREELRLLRHRIDVELKPGQRLTFERLLRQGPARGPAGPWFLRRREGRVEESPPPGSGPGAGHRRALHPQGDLPPEEATGPGSTATPSVERAPEPARREGPGS